MDFPVTWRGVLAAFEERDSKLGRVSPPRDNAPAWSSRRRCIGFPSKIESMRLIHRGLLNGHPILAISLYICHRRNRFGNTRIMWVEA